MIRCITFDLDDTLWAVDPVIRHANQSMFDWLEQYAPEFTRCYQLQDLMHLRKEALKAEPDIAYSVTRIRIAQLRYGMKQAGYSTEIADELTEKAFEVFLHARQQVEFFEHAREMLTELKQQGYQLGALTNGNADIHKVGLSDLMDFQFKADDVGEMKPHPLMFQQMLHHTGLRAEQVIHIGDNPEHDIEGAAAAGLWTIWVNINAEGMCPTATEQVYVLKKIPEKVELIKAKANQRVTL